MVLVPTLICQDLLRSQLVYIRIELSQAITIRAEFQDFRAHSVVYIDDSVKVAT